MDEQIVAKQPLATFYAFERFQSEADYEARTGQKAPAFDARRPPKYWRDLGALTSPRASVVYDALAVAENGAPLMDPATKRPYVDALVLRKPEAATVNIPPAWTTSPVEAEVPVPLRPLGAYQYLDYGDTPFEGVVVRDSRAETLRPVTYTRADQEALHAIARELGVEA